MRGADSFANAQIFGDAPPMFINRCGGLKIGDDRFAQHFLSLRRRCPGLPLADRDAGSRRLRAEQGRPDSLYSAAADGLRRIHEALGVLVFIVVVLQLLWRLIDSTPAKQPMPRWMAAASKLVHFALYALLIAIPATAVLGTWLVGIPVTLPGFDIAPPIAKAHGLGQLIMKIHTTLGDAILWVAGVHAAAALFHHFYLRDEVFQSMASGRMND